MWLYIYLDVQLGPAGPRTCSIDQSIEAPQHQGQLFNTRHELSSVIPSSSPKTLSHIQQVSELNCNTTKKLHRDIQESLRRLNREHGSSRLYDWSKLYYNRLLPTGNSSPAPRFYGLPKIHKTNCPMHPIVSACGTATYQLAKFLTKILQRYTGITPSFVKDSKSFSDHLRTVEISGEEELVSFDVSALFTSIPVPTALDVINRLFTEHIEDPDTKDKYGCSFRRNTIGLEKDEVMSLLKLVLENCVFTFQNRFYKQLHGAAMGSPCSPVVANIYMEYFENMALGPELPVPIKDWKRYVDDVFSIIPKGNRDKLLKYLNSIDPHIKFTIEQPNAEGGIPFLDTFPKPQGGGHSGSSLQKANPHRQIPGLQLQPRLYRPKEL